MKTMETRTKGSTTTSRGRYGLIAVVAVLAVVVVAGGWLLLRSDEKTATDHVQDAAAAMRNEDMDKSAEIFGFDNMEVTEYRFVDWHIGWNAQPEFSEVVETPREAGSHRLPGGRHLWR